jgi:hypothetical protein
VVNKDLKEYQEQTELTVQMGQPEHKGYKVRLDPQEQMVPMEQTE